MSRRKPLSSQSDRIDQSVWNRTEGVAEKQRDLIELFARADVEGRRRFLEEPDRHGATVQGAIEYFVEWALTQDVPASALRLNGGETVEGWYIGRVHHSHIGENSMDYSVEDLALFISDDMVAYWTGVPPRTSLPVAECDIYDVPVSKVEEWMAEFVAASGRPWR